MTQTNWAGRKLGNRYVLEELLGQGGMSAVYKATDPNLQRVVAVKMIHPHLSGNQEFVQRFESEAAAVAQLRHPNIIQVYDFDNDEGTYYMVLEFVPGETLQERLKRLNDAGRKMPPKVAVKYAQEVCEAVEYAHQRDMIHRDIKPANIMLNVQGHAILMDFGIAKIVGGQQHTATGAVIGTALYMSPEQIRGMKIDGRSDVYSIGVTLFEMVSGHPPFEADSAMSLMMMHVNDPIPDLRQIQSNVPPGLIAVIEKALAKDRDERFQSAAEMARALGDALSDRRGAAASAAGAVTPLAPDATYVESPTAVAGSAAAPPSDATYVESAAAGALVGAASSPPQGPPIEPTARVGAVGGPSATYQSPPPPPGGTSGTMPFGAAGESAPPQRKINPLLIGGVVAVLLILCLGVGGYYAFNAFSGDEPTLVANQDEVLSTATLEEAVTPTEAEPTATTPPTATSPPTATLPPTDTPTPTLSPTPTIPPGIPYVVITNITIEGSYYVVEYETYEYTEQLPGMHVHFFFDTVPPEEAGSPGSGPWKLYGGPRPFKGYALNNRPAGAAMMCALVANPNHSVQPDSGTCYPLPDVEQ